MAEGEEVLMEAKAPAEVARKEEAVAVAVAVAVAARMMVAVTAGWMIHAVALAEEAEEAAVVLAAAVEVVVVEVCLLFAWNAKLTRLMPQVK